MYTKRTQRKEIFMASRMKRGGNHVNYEKRKPDDRCWASVNGHDDKQRKQFFAPVQSNLPDDAFADDVVPNDDIGTYITQPIGMVAQWGTLGEYVYKEKDPWS